MAPAGASADPTDAGGATPSTDSNPDSPTRTVRESPSAEREATGSTGRHAFPIRGAHTIGKAATNGFGGGRGHQGQDIFAACGTPVVAARAGLVKRAGFQGAAGNYVVIRGAGTGQDYVYMHLQSAPAVRSGAVVSTGQKLGAVGDTGRATGCHLHFELWSAPGWYSGGSPFDPLPSLRAWGG